MLLDGTVDGLPSGMDGVVEQGFAGAGGPTDTLSALAVVVAHAHRGTGLSSRMIVAFGERAASHGLGRLIGPLRPVWKERYPLVPIDR